jgi:hypothetical protein
MTPLPRAALLLLLAAGPARAAEDLPQDLAGAAAGEAIGAARACGMEEEALDPVSTACIRRTSSHPQAGRLAALFSIAQVSACQRTTIDGGAACGAASARLEALRQMP